MAEGKRDKKVQKISFRNKINKNKAHNHTQQMTVCCHKLVFMLCEGGVCFPAQGNGRRDGGGTAALS